MMLIFPHLPKQKAGIIPCREIMRVHRYAFSSALRIRPCMLRPCSCMRSYVHDSRVHDDDAQDDEAETRPCPGFDFLFQQGVIFQLLL